MDEKQVEIGERIRTIRRNLNITQKQLAGKLGVSQTAVALWESGVRGINIDVIEQIANLFDITPAQLMGWEYIDPTFSGKEAPPETYDKLKSNIEKHHGKSRSQASTLAAHFDGDEYTADELEEIRQFAEFVKSKREKKDSSDRLTVQAAHKRTDIDVTDEMRQHDDDIMNDENF